MNTKSIRIFDVVKFKVGQYLQLSKFRLSSFVVFSSMIGFIYGSIGLPFSWMKFILFTMGGTLVTFASNAINQYIEKESDGLMDRTKNRPLPQNQLSNVETIVYIGITALLGILILTFTINPMTGVIAALSLLIYAFIYTPLKKVSSISVFVGAIPGALPPLIGYVGATNMLNEVAIWLFLVQFIWQFPHFWAIAWVSYEDYLKADIMMLPNEGGKNKQSAFITLMYTIILIPLSLYPMYLFGKSSIGVAVLLTASIVFSYLAYKLYKTLQDREAKKLMFGSFFYLIIFLLSIFFIN